MCSRRKFLTASLSTRAVVLLALLSVFLVAGFTHITQATAITQVFGNGQRLTAIAVEYDREIDGSKLS